MISLGKLERVFHIYAEALAFRVKQQWNLSCQDTLMNAEYNMPAFMTLLEGESLELPVSMAGGVDKFSRDNLRIVRFFDRKAIEDYFDKAKLVTAGDAATGYHKLVIEDMQQGIYNLKLVDGFQIREIEVKVTKGDYWEESEGFIILKNRLEAVKDETKNVMFNKLAVETTGAGQKVTMQIANSTKHTRVHAIATSFLPNNSRLLNDTLKTISLRGGETFKFSKEDSKY